MDTIYKQIEAIITNARTSLYKGYLPDTIQAKKVELERLESESVEILGSTETSQADKQGHTEKFSKLKQEALEVLQLHEDKYNESEEDFTETDILFIEKLLIKCCICSTFQI